MEKTNEKKDFLQKTWVVCALALVCTFLWGSASPCIKLGYALFKIPSSETWTQVLFAGTRFVFAGVLTILIGSILNRKMLLPTKSSVPNIVNWQCSRQFCSTYSSISDLHTTAEYRRQ